jgi:8-oxo-dGTP diphosphatase
MQKRRRGTAVVDTSKGIVVVSMSGRTYSLPGGGARRGESREKATIRELREETGLIAADCSYLFEYTSFSTCHKVFLINCDGTPEPRHEIKHVAYFNPNNSRITISYTTQKIIDRYLGKNYSKYEYFQLKCPNCGASLNISTLSGSITCEHCGNIFHRKK